MQHSASTAGTVLIDRLLLLTWIDRPLTTLASTHVDDTPVRRHDDRASRPARTLGPGRGVRLRLGGQSLAANAGRLIAPVAAGALISAAGYGPAFSLVAACSLATAALLLAAERAHAHPA